MNRNLFIFLFVILLVLRYLYRIRQDRVVVSLTTSPERIKFIKPVLDSIQHQTRKPDKIYLNLPKKFLRNNSTFDSLPDFIKEDPLIHVNFCNDIGPATKIIPTLFLESNPETYILSIDDDIHYPANLIEDYLYHSKKFDSIITGYSIVDNKSHIDQKWFNRNNQNNLKYNCTLVDVFEGFSGILYKRKFFNRNFLNDFYKHINGDGCRFGDDFYLSNFFKKYGIKTVCLNININWNKTPDNKSLTPLIYGFNQDALHLGAGGGNKNNYIKASKYLETQNELYIKHYLS